MLGHPKHRVMTRYGTILPLRPPNAERHAITAPVEPRATITNRSQSCTQR